MITVKYFASLREQLGRDQDQVEYSDGLTISDIWARLNSALSDSENKPPAGLLCAQNMEYTQWKSIVSDGDEIAFFPPVTGG